MSLDIGDCLSDQVHDSSENRFERLRQSSGLDQMVTVVDEGAAQDQHLRTVADDVGLKSISFVFVLF